MAQTLPHDQFYLDLHGIDLDGVGRDVARYYLQMQLRQIDSQIENLVRVQTQESWYMLERAAWSQPAAAEIVWTGRLELFYLEAVRDELLETLANL